MKVVFRVDSSTQIGSGHLMRCLTLAGQLHKEKQAEILFLSRDLPGNLAKLVREKGYQLVLLPRAKENAAFAGYAKWLTVTQDEDARECIDVLREEASVDMLVVDSYAIDERWESQVRPFVQKIMVIDDLANRKHDCDILLDQNFPADRETLYEHLIPKICKKFIGPRYLLLRDEFYAAQKKLSKRTGSVKNIFVFFGGMDATNETMKALRALTDLSVEHLHICVVVGATNPHKNEVADYCEKYDNISFFCQINNIAELMARADLAIGAGGATIWERCFLRLPTVVISVADNQADGCKFCHACKIIYYIGKGTDVLEMDIKDAVQLFLDEQGGIYKECVRAMEHEFPEQQRNMVVDYFG